MAGIYSDPLARRVPDAYRQPEISPLIGRQWSGEPGTYPTPPFPAGPGWIQAVGAGQRPGELAGRRSASPFATSRQGRLGALGAADDGLSTATYAATSLVGAAAGGALLGYVASGSAEGAKTGALFSAGLGAISDAVLFGREGQSGAMAAMAFVGVGALSLSLLRFHGTVTRSR